MAGDCLVLVSEPRKTRGLWILQRARFSLRISSRTSRSLEKRNGGDGDARTTSRLSLRKRREKKREDESLKA